MLHTLLDRNKDISSNKSPGIFARKLCEKVHKFGLSGTSHHRLRDVDDSTAPPGTPLPLTHPLATKFRWGPLQRACTATLCCGVVWPWGLGCRGDTGNPPVAPGNV
jgi:hypothetical protein